MKQCYHEECDDLTKVTQEKLEFLAKITEMLARYEIEMSTEQSASVCGGSPQENWEHGTITDTRSQTESNQESYSNMCSVH